MRGHVDVALLVLEKGAEVDRATEDGQTPLYFACENGHVDAARLLLDRGADVHRGSSNGTTPLHMSCYKGHIETVRLLLDNGAVADLNVADDDGDTPKANAEYGGHAAVVD